MDNKQCYECGNRLTSITMLNEYHRYICSDCGEKEFPLMCRSCLKAKDDTDPDTRLCTHCKENKSIFHTDCTACSEEFITRDLDLTTCENCDALTGVCFNCQSRFDMINPDDELCEVCRIHKGCFACGARSKLTKGEFCTSCDYRITNGICTSCNRKLRHYDSVNSKGECGKCSDPSWELTGRERRITCVYCNTAEATSQSDFLCNGCREKLKKKKVVM